MDKPDQGKYCTICTEVPCGKNNYGQLMCKGHLKGCCTICTKVPCGKNNYGQFMCKEHILN